MIGSRRKKKDFFYTIKKEGISSQRLDEIHAPIGLNIHAETPAEIIQVRGKQRPWREIGFFEIESLGWMLSKNPCTMQGKNTDSYPALEISNNNLWWISHMM